MISDAGLVPLGMCRRIDTAAGLRASERCFPKSCLDSVVDSEIDCPCWKITEYRRA